MISITKRITYHKEQSDYLRQLIADHDAVTGSHCQIAKAIHDVAISILSTQVQETDIRKEMEDLGEKLGRLKVAADNHREAMNKAYQGLAPWGEIRGATATLQAAIEEIYGPEAPG